MTWRSVVKACVVAVTVTACIVGLRFVDPRHNVHRWEGGDGPDTECRYEQLANGHVSPGGGRTYGEQWTVCDPGETE